jgi:archaellum component FlaG (FlaF/FlaG flagellin family)
MADGGASTMILLVTSLLLSGTASVILLQSWGDVAQASGVNASGRVADAETEVSFSGDRGDVLLDTSGANQQITFYFQNSGIRSLDKSSFSIFVDGIPAPSVGAVALYPANGVWASDHILQVTVSDPSFNYNDGDFAIVTIVVQSTVSEGTKGTNSETAKVRLSV